VTQRNTNRLGMSVAALCWSVIPQFIFFYISILGEFSQIEQCFIVILKSLNINIIVMQA